ncbi:hypothetical protein PUN28_016409 [Cardiocondyla obscurior]|uniref:Uncharacterized protein n=1 Tax=Cardiocondyla obscurior TaxID=286306 RepID=A0AAW2ELX9_9HYME
MYVCIRTSKPAKHISILCANIKNILLFKSFISEKDDFNGIIYASSVSNVNISQYVSKISQIILRDRIDSYSRVRIGLDPISTHNIRARLAKCEGEKKRSERHFIRGCGNAPIDMMRRDARRELATNIHARMFIREIDRRASTVLSFFILFQIF